MVISRRVFASLLIGASACARTGERGAAAQAQLPAPPESYEIYTEHPRLFLTPQRLRLLRRERERESMRWQQFSLLIGGGAAMPEQGFALALYHQVAGDERAARRAVEWALGPASDARQLALVFDWCQQALDERRSAALAAKLRRELERSRTPASFAEARTRTLAAIALAGHAGQLPKGVLRPIIEQWWPASAAALKAGRNIVARGDLYALFELMHAVQDNLRIDLREWAPGFFKELPIYDLISYYPASYPAAENEYRIPAVKGAEPDLDLATMSRAAELAMVAYDTNAQENQYLQGWLMHDRFLLRGQLGIVYEYLWANPYQPGLSYHTLPAVFHDRTFGRLFVRSNWDDDAHWLGYFDGQLQTFSDGEPRVLPLNAAQDPIQFGDTAIAAALKFTLRSEAKSVFVIGLDPLRSYDVEVDDQEMHEEHTDPGGILALEFAQPWRGGIRLKRARDRR